MLSSWWRKHVLTRMTRAAGRNRGVRLRMESLEDRTTPAGIAAVGSAPGVAASVSVFDAATHQQKFTLTPYAGFTGGVNVAIGDVNGDGTADVITGPGAGGAPTVNVFSGIDGSLLKTFTVGDTSSRAGATVAAADFDGDGLADLVVGTMRNGQPLVQVLRFSDGTALHGYTPFTGSVGVSVAAGDVNGDGTPDTVIGAGSGGGPRVVVMDGKTDTKILDFLAFESSFTGGIRVSAGDLNGDGLADMVAAAGSGGGPRVQAFAGADGRVIQNFFAYSDQLRDGVWATASDADGNGSIDILTASGASQTNAKAFDGRTLATLSTPLFPGLAATAVWGATAPSVTLSSTAPDPTNTSPIAVTATFSEAVNGFTQAGLTATGGAVSDFTRVDASTYTFNLTPTTNGTVSVTANAGAATNAAGTANVSASLSRTFDTAAPTVGVGALTTNDTTPTLSGTASGATSVQVTVNGQTITGTISGSTWSAAVPTALAAGTYTVTATARDAAGNSATGTGSLVIDTTAPTVTGVNSTTTNGAYKVGATVSIQVAFTEPVTVAGGPPTLTLNSGGSAAFTGGSGTNTLTFTYTVAAGQNAADLDYASTTALVLSGATIRDAAGNNATLTLPAPGAANSLGANKAIVIDTAVPTGAVNAAVAASAITGTAGDGTGSGVNQVQVKVQNVGGQFWNPGTQTFVATDPGFTNATDTSGNGSWATWSFPFTAGTGAYTVTLQVTDAAGNQANPTGTANVP